MPYDVILIPKNSFWNTVCSSMVMQIKLVFVVVVPSAYCASFSQWGLQSFETKNLAVILITLLVLNFTILGETIICWVLFSRFQKANMKKKGLNFAIHTFSGAFYLQKTLNLLKFRLQNGTVPWEKKKNTSLFKRSHIDEK